VPAVTLDAVGRSQLDQVLVGLLPADALPGNPGDTYLDEEATPIARHDSDGVTPLTVVRWRTPAEVFTDAAVVLARAGELPAESLPDGVVLLLPAAGIRPDDARHITWTRAWTETARSVIEIPVAPQDAVSRAAELVAAYSSGGLRDVPTTPQPPGGGMTVLLSGLSGSGKSTIARALVDALAGERSITLLDGDVVRTHLSRGLGFSREDRDLNVRRIGWVAAEVTKHGGLAVCAPISPYDETRKWVRGIVESAGGPGAFVLVWISTPLEECERRDVKGWYAKARAGEISGFTGIDDPYEAPTDAEVVIDTTEVSVEAAVETIIGTVRQHQRTLPR
jgi:sulfate adenylyltransferase